MSATPTPRTDAAAKAVNALETVSEFHSRFIDFARQLERELNDLHVKDRVRTRECNILVEENRRLAKELSESGAAAWHEGYAIGYTNGSNAARAYERGEGATSAGLEREAEWQHSDTRAALDARTKTL